MPDALGAAKEMVAEELRGKLAEEYPDILSLEEGVLVLRYGGVEDWMVEITLLPMGAGDVAL